MTGNRKRESHFDAELKRGAGLFGAGNYVESKEIFDLLYKKYPDDEEVQNYLGMVLFKLGLHKEAIRLFKELLEKAPTYPSLHLNLGIVYYKGGNFDQAFNEFLSALEYDPENKRAQNYIGLIHLAKGRLDEALTTFELTDSKKMIKQVKDSIREQKRATIMAAKQKNAPNKKAEKEASANGHKEILKGKNKLDFAALKKSLLSTKSESVSSIQETAVDLMRNAFKGESEFIDTYENLVKLNVRGELFTRLSLLDSYSGDLHSKPAYKVIKKNETKEVLGKKDDIIFNVSGNGSLILSLGSLKITAFTLERDKCFYVIEDHLLTFERSVSYENSSDKFGDEFDLVKLSGAGTAVLISSKKPITHAISEVTPLTIRLDNIIGWYGDLKTKFIKDKESMFKRRQDAKWVNFKGNGFVFCKIKE